MVKKPLSDNIIKNVIATKQQKRVKLPDAIIGATAFCENCTLITRNISDFEKIFDIVIYNPFE